MTYLVFGGETYYAQGGAHDLLAIYSDGELVNAFEEAQAFAVDLIRRHEIDWFHITDGGGKIITGTESQALGAEDIEDGWRWNRADKLIVGKRSEAAKRAGL